jgi:2'-5' RNA ligase
MSLADLAPGQHAQQVRNHWWWRPGWQVGRRFYAFHITFEGQAELYQLIGAYRSALADAPAVTLIPDQWLHLTMQGMGFTDELPPSTATEIAEKARAILATIAPFEVKFGEIVVADEAIALPAQPPEPVRELRAATREAISQILGDDQVPEDPDKFRPHVSAAYITADGSSEPYVTAIQSMRPDPVAVRISRVDLIEMHRDHRMYECTVVASLPLSG